MEEKIKGIFWGLIACLILTLLFGCKSTKYIPVETVKTDSIYVERFHRDSVFMRDSIFVNQYSKGDTVFIDKVAVKYAYKDRWRYDTVAIMRADTISIPYPVEKDLGWWEKVCIDIFPVSLITIIILAFVIIWIVRNKLK